MESRVSWAAFSLEVGRGGAFLPLPASGGLRYALVWGNIPQSLPLSSHGHLPVSLM